MYISLHRGVPLCARNITIFYHPLLRPLIKVLEELDSGAFNNFLTSNICMITWITKCKVQIVAECIYVWSDRTQLSFASYANPRCYEETKIIEDMYELNQSVINAIKLQLQN